MHEVGLGPFQRGLGLLERRFIRSRIDPGQHRAFLHDGAVVDQLRRIVGVAAELQDQAHDLGADVDHLFRLHGSGGADRREQVAAGDGRGAEAACRRGRHVFAIVAGAAGRQGHERQEQGNPPHRISLSLGSQPDGFDMRNRK